MPDRLQQFRRASPAVAIGKVYRVTAYKQGARSDDGNQTCVNLAFRYGTRALNEMLTLYQFFDVLPCAGR